MILKDRLVLSNQTWGIRNLDMVFDALFLVFVTSLGILFTIQNPSFFLVPFFSILLPSMGLYAFFSKKIQYSYPILFILEAGMAFLCFPVAWMQSHLIWITPTLSWVLYGLARYYFHLKIPYFFYILLVHGLGLFLFSNFPEGNLSTLNEPFLWLPNFQTCRIGLPFCQTSWENIWIHLSWLGGFPFCIAILCRWLVYPIGILLVTWILWIFQGTVEGMGIAQAIQYAGMFFGMYLLPGKSKYSLWLVSFLSLILVFLLSWLVSLMNSSTELAIFLWMGLFFMLESLISFLFYGIKRGKKPL